MLTKKKITINFTQEALEFTRQINPLNKKNIYQHYGIYFYKLSALKKLSAIGQKKKLEKNLSRLGPWKIK